MELTTGMRLDSYANAYRYIHKFEYVVTVLL